MIILDTHILVWWVSGSDRLSQRQHQVIIEASSTGIGVSAITCWEIAKLVERDRLTLDRPVLTWLEAALVHPGVRLLELTPEIAVESTRLPGTFHHDPADQIIVATARLMKSRLVTSDQKIIDYTFVDTVA